jgi:hypothetical protein
VLVSRNTCASKKSELFPMSRTATGPIGAIVGIRARPDPVAGRRLVHQRVEPISVPRAEAVQYPVVLPCGVSEVGPGLLTSGDYRSDMIPASRCGCCM